MFGVLSSPVYAVCPVPAALAWVRVQQVVDGDTLRLKDGRRIRLVGINAPELSGPRRTPEPFAETSRDRLRQLVDESGGQVGLTITGKDRYGRTLAHVFARTEENLEAQLLAEGLGYFIAFAPATALRECQQGAEQRARTAGLGLWRKPAIKAPGQIVAGGFALTEGRVARVEQNRGGLWLQMDGPLVLRVEPRLLGHFDARSLHSLVGKRVSARGWVVDRARGGKTVRGQARWMLLLSDPAMLLRAAP